MPWHNGTARRGRTACPPVAVSPPTPGIVAAGVADPALPAPAPARGRAPAARAAAAAGAARLSVRGAGGGMHPWGGGGGAAVGAGVRAGVVSGLPPPLPPCPAAACLHWAQMWMAWAWPKMCKKVGFKSWVKTGLPPWVQFPQESGTGRSSPPSCPTRTQPLFKPDGPRLQWVSSILPGQGKGEGGRGRRPVPHTCLTAPVMVLVLRTAQPQRRARPHCPSDERPRTTRVFLSVKECRPPAAVGYSTTTVGSPPTVVGCPPTAVGCPSSTTQLCS